MKLRPGRHFAVFMFLLSILLISCYHNVENGEDQESPINEKSVEYMARAMDLADADMERNPEAWMLDFNSNPRWNYTHGVVCTGLERLWKYTGNVKYYKYIKDYADYMINDEGQIKTYNLEAYNIDMINTGKFLFAMYKETKDEKYKKAIDLLRDQMSTHPRTSEGGFWHKKRYPWQMWLDGLYMGSPFLAQYAKEFNEPELFDDVANQINLINKYTLDPETGLFYHGWDESKKEKWADPVSGLSKNFWGRGMGWYAMALVDVLDYFPKDHEAYPMILETIQNMAEAIKNYQDEESGVWYQVLDQGNREGNYLESSVSTMFVYFLIKSIRLGYIDDNFLPVAINGMEGIEKEFIKTNDDGLVEITDVCAGAGLGGNPYRDGSYEYYINESIRNNDPKAVGPYIYMMIEFAKYESNQNKI